MSWRREMLAALAIRATIYPIPIPSVSHLPNTPGAGSVDDAFRVKPRPFHKLPRLGSRVLAVFEHLLAVDEPMRHAGGVLGRLGIGGGVLHQGRVEDGQVGGVAGV